MTDEIAAFILARIDEDEFAAIAAPRGPWTWAAVGTSGYPQRVTNATATLIAQCYENPDRPATIPEHIARQDPAATLARCAALRALVELHRPTTTEFADFYDGDDRISADCVECDKSGLPDTWPCPTIRHIAEIWASHINYRKEWKVP